MKTKPSQFIAPCGCSFWWDWSIEPQFQQWWYAECVNYCTQHELIDGSPDTPGIPPHVISAGHCMAAQGVGR